MAEVQVEFPRIREYRDVSLTFAANPVTNDLVAVTGSAAVIRSLKMLLQTFAGEVPFYPHFGSVLQRLLFEPMDSITLSLLRQEIFATITAYEPRVSVMALDVLPDEEQHRYEITMTVSINNISQPVTFSLYLSRIR